MTERKSVIVTGGGSGIGKAAAVLLAQGGWAVTVADRDADGGAGVVEEILTAGGIAQFVRTDVADESSVVHMVERAVAAYGHLDAAINSAGIPQRGLSIRDLDAESWDLCNTVNLRGMFLCLKHEVAAMWERRRGAIVAISSAAATKGLVNSADYCAAKAGITGLVRGAAVDCAPQGIRINALLPGATMTPLATRSSASTPNLSGTLKWPIGRMAEPEEVAEAAIWLISDTSSYMTGASVAVDGGMSIV